MTTAPNLPARAPAEQAGFSLVEVLVTIVILSFGMLGSLVVETNSIAGGALSDRELRSKTEASVFQGSFNPLPNDWSGKVKKFALDLSSDEKTATVAQTPAWNAADLLTARTRTDHGRDRNIVVGPPTGQQGVVPPSLFLWGSSLANAHQIALNQTAQGVEDTLGEERLQYLRGDRRRERSGSDHRRPFRPRQLVLGSVVNSGLVYQGAPKDALAGRGHQGFLQRHKNRTPVVFTNANDGMLHAFRASDGHELFAYIPGFIVPRLTILTDLDYTHRPLLDATPTVGEAQLDGQWRSVLVSGAGAGAQGIFALDVSDPTAFSKDSVLWEFTDADHPAMGNVLGKPRIARVRMNDPGSGTDNHKWMAVVPSGVNNHRPDEHTNTSAHPSIFLIDLEARPSPSAPWKEGVNFWRIELPPGNDSAAPGLIQINTVQTPGNGVLETIVAGDLHGNVWMLSFRQKGVKTLGKDGLANLSALNAVGAHQHPMYVARAPDGARQPITSAPVIANGFGGRRLILVGTGKFLEAGDNSVPTTPAASFYALPESTNPVADRGTLQGTSIDANGKISAESSSPGTQGKQKQGWYIDFSSAAGERLVSDPMLDRGRLVFTTLTPSGGACGEGGGRYFEVDVLTGQGASWDSTVGLLGGPMLVSLGNPVVSDSDTSGRRTAIYRQTPITQGGNGLDVGGGGTSTLTFTQQVGRMSWRQVHNHQHVAP